MISVILSSLLVLLYLTVVCEFAVEIRDDMWHYSGTSAMRGEMYSEWRRPKEKLGAFGFVKVTCKRKKVSVWTTCWGLFDDEIRLNGVSYLLRTVCSRSWFLSGFTRSKVAACHAVLGRFLPVNTRIHNFVGSRARSLEGKQMYS